MTCKNGFSNYLFLNKMLSRILINRNQEYYVNSYFIGFFFNPF